MIYELDSVLLVPVVRRSEMKQVTCIIVWEKVELEGKRRSRSAW